jgi:Leucine-rich repeat (LRR) protein
MGALSKLDASDNSMFGKGDKAGITAWADALKANTSITELNLAKNGITANDTKILAPAISDNEALTSLNLASNSIGGYKDTSFPYECHIQLQKVPLLFWVVLLF